MYSASAQYLSAITSDTVELGWSGTITTVGGNTYTFTKDNMSPDSSSITRTLSTQKLKIGQAWTAGLTLELILPGVSRYELYGASISISNTVTGASDTIPMGQFTVISASQTADHINLSANDNMIKFEDVNFSAASYSTVQTPYNWLTQMCTLCGVTLGNTQAEIEALPNGKRKTGFADCVTDAETWRDVLSYITAYLGSNALIGRDGKLYIVQYSSTSIETVSEILRYSSDLSDYRTTYDGLYAVYKNDGVQEYVSNTNTGGLVLDLGTNPFLQFSNDQNREDALQEIIDAWDGIYYVPFNSSVAIIPILDPGDVITFTGNQADAYDYGAVTQITYGFNGDMTVVCAGENPILADAQDRFTKTVAGLAADHQNGQEIGDKDFWLLFNHSTEDMTVGSTETLITEIEYEQKTFCQNLEMILTLEADLSATATVNIRVNVDDDLDLEMDVTEEKSMIGKRMFHCSNPQKVYGEGTHSCKVYMTVTDSPLIWSELV